MSLGHRLPLLLFIVLGLIQAHQSASGHQLAYSTFAGGTGGDYAYALAIDQDGFVYLAGDTTSTDFPLLPGVFHSLADGGSESDVLLLKLSADLGTLLAATTIGGSGNDWAVDITIDSAGNPVITGTGGPMYPTTAGAYNTTYNGGQSDLVVTRLTPDLENLLDSTLVGGSGSGWDRGTGLVLTPSGEVVVSGWTESTDFPVTGGAADSSFGGSEEALVLKLSPGLEQLLASTFLGGTADDRAGGVTCDAAGMVVVAGKTRSADFPVTAGVWDSTLNDGTGDGWDLFVARLTPGLDVISESTFVGGSADDGGTYPWDIGLEPVLDQNGDLLLSGMTESADFPVTPDAYGQIYRGGTYGDLFVIRLSADFSSLTASTLLGGAGSDMGASLAVEPGGNLLLTGLTASNDFPTTPGAWDESHNGDYDVFVARFTPDLRTLAWSSLIGGPEEDSGWAICQAPSGRTMVAGFTRSPDFPVTAGGYDTSHNGGRDVFILEINTGTVTTDLSVQPSSGTLPFSTLICCRLDCRAPTARRVSARLDLGLAGGGFISSFRSGYRVMNPGEEYTVCWQQAFPALASLVGTSEFILHALDTTPPPYNLPPFPVAGDEDRAVRLVTGFAP